jgi:hypothetical protein
VAASDVSVRVVNDVSLAAHAAPMPNYNEHGVLVGWPPEKHEQKAIAAKLVLQASLAFPPG